MLYIRSVIKSRKQDSSDTENLIYCRSEPKHDLRHQIFISSRVFKPKVGLLQVFAYTFMILVGVIIFYSNLQSNKIIYETLFPLLFTIIGVLWAIHIHTTRYEINNYSLKAFSKFSKVEIPYKEIKEVKFAKTNQFFKHGNYGRLVMGTHSNTIWITASTPFKRKYHTLIISPFKEKEFTLLLKQKLQTT